MNNLSSPDVTEKPSVLFMGTPEFCLPTLESLKNSNELNLKLVVTQPDAKRGRKMKLTPSPVKAYCLEHGLEVETPEKVSSPDFIEYLKEQAFDIVVVLAYGQLLKKNLLETYPDRFINIHGSLLPRWRGAAPIQRALMQGDEESGLSFQLMRLKLDSGPVIYEHKIPLDFHMDSVELQKTLSDLSGELIEDVCLKWIRNELTPKEQEEGQVTYASKIQKEESELDLSLKALDLHNKIRGLQWGPGAFIFKGDKRLKILDSDVKKREDLPNCTSENIPWGSYVGLSEDRLWIQTGQDLLGVKTVQIQGKPKVSAKDFINGYNLTSGFRFIKS